MLRLLKNVFEFYFYLKFKMLEVVLCLWYYESNIELDMK